MRIDGRKKKKSVDTILHWRAKMKINVTREFSPFDEEGRSPRGSLSIGEEEARKNARA